MKSDEVNAVDLSPCVRIFIESLLSEESPKDVARDTGTTESSMDIKKGSRKAKQSETKSPSFNYT
jgi:hypothetical protein